MRSRAASRESRAARRLWAARREPARFAI